MTKHMMATLVLGLTSFGAPAMSAQWLEPCLTASYISAPPAPVMNREQAEPELKPTPSNALGCKRGVSRRVDAITTIWRCQVELEDGAEFKEGQPEYGFLIERRGYPLQELPDELMTGAFDNFDVINVDLDHSEGREHILAAWNGQGNGIGVNQWTIFVFDTNWNLTERFDDVVDWGPSNLVAAPKPRAGCDIAITTFEPVLPSSGAIELRARFLRAGPRSADLRQPALTLEVASDRPTLARRYTRAFEATRASWFSKGEWQWRGDIATWLNNAATKARPYAP